MTVFAAAFASTTSADVSFLRPRGADLVRIATLGFVAGAPFVFFQKLLCGRCVRVANLIYTQVRDAARARSRRRAVARSRGRGHRPGVSGRHEAPQ